MAKAARRLAEGEMSGLQKASVLMLALGEEQAGKLFSMMHEDEIKSISAAMAQLGVIHADTVEHLCTDFVDNFGATGGIMGSFESTENLLMKALPKERISPDRRRLAVDDQAPPFRAGADTAAGLVRDGSRHAHAADGIDPERRPGTCRAHPAGGVHVQPGARVAAGFAPVDRGNLQQFRPQGGNPLPRRP